MAQTFMFAEAIVKKPEAAPQFRGAARLQQVTARARYVTLLPVV